MAGVRRVRAPTPEDTAKLAAVPLVVHAPPTSALPNLLVTALAKASETKAVVPGAGGGGAGAVTVTGWDTVPVAPRSSVTTSVTW